MEGLRRVHEPERVRLARPRLEGRLDELDAGKRREVSPRDRAHARARLETEDREPASREGQGRDAGADADLEEPRIRTDPRPRDQIRDQRLGVSRPVSVVRLADRVERGPLRGVGVHARRG